MSLKQLFYAAFTARVISWLTLAAFFFCLVMDLELKTAVLCLGLSHLAWILGTMFLGVFREHMADIASTVLSSAMMAAEEEEELKPKDLSEVMSHPLFSDDEGENNE